MPGRLFSWGVSKRALSPWPLPMHWRLHEFLGSFQANYLILPSPPCPLKINTAAKLTRKMHDPTFPNCISCADFNPQVPGGTELPQVWGGPFVWCDWGPCGWPCSRPCWRRASLCFRHTSIAHRQLLPKQDPFSTGITEDLTMNLEYLQPQDI